MFHKKLENVSLKDKKNRFQAKRPTIGLHCFIKSPKKLINTSVRMDILCVLGRRVYFEKKEKVSFSHSGFDFFLTLTRQNGRGSINFLG